MKRIPTALWLALAAVAQAGAGQISGSPDRVVAFDKSRVIAVYTSSIARNGDVVIAWIRISHAPPAIDAGGSAYHSEKIRARFHCNARTWSPVERHRFDADGKAVSSPAQEETGSYCPVEKDLVAQSVLEYVCNFRGETPQRLEKLM